MTKDVAVNLMTNNQYLQAILTADINVWRWDLTIKEERLQDCNLEVEMETSNI